VYCGAELPPEAVAAAAAARAALEADWAREGGSSLGAPAGASPVAPADAPTAGRVLLVLDLDGADEGALARALGLSAFEAGQRRRRGGMDLHRILPEAPAREEAARLRGYGLHVVEIADEEVRRGMEPVIVFRGTAEPGALALEGDGGRLRMTEDDVLLIVRGTIAREYPVSSEVRRVRLSTLEPGYRVHLHRRADSHPIELDPSAFEFGAGGAPGGAQLQIASWLDRLFPRMPRDDSFRLVIPALAPALPPAGGSAAAAAALTRPGGERRAILDNVAQFRFHSAWRGAAWRRRGGALTP
jgi:hypothetical protein